MKDTPLPLLRRFLFTLLIGGGCMLVGTVFLITVGDAPFFFLSLAVLLCCLGRAYSLHRLVKAGKYEMVTGVCTAIRPGLGRFRKVKIQEDSGAQTTLRLPKSCKIRLGEPYRFYFKPHPAIQTGSSRLDSLLSSDCFLGFEPAEKDQKEEEEHV